MNEQKIFASPEDELLRYKDNLRSGLLQYTRRAFHLLPHIASPYILDIGCGSGVPTMELARLSHGKITAIDIDQAQLDKLFIIAKQAGLLEHINILKCSILNMDFKEESFDIIWAEGSIAVIGFKRGLTEWRRFLKTGGFLVVHDDMEHLNEKIRNISQCGYDLLEQFTLNNNIWWDEYFAPLENKLREIRKKYPYDQALNVILDHEQREIDGISKYPVRNSSVFLVMKKQPIHV